MNKLPKYIFIAFILFNVIGGTILGVLQYKEEQDTKKAFESFYTSDTQVMGAYDNKSSGIPSGYIFGGIAVFVGLTGVGMVYSVIKREYLKKSKNKNLEF